MTASKKKIREDPVGGVPRPLTVWVAHPCPAAVHAPLAKLTHRLLDGGGGETTEWHNGLGAIAAQLARFEMRCAPMGSAAAAF